ncbi:hypothetical protein K466DRAFT_587092 [Polyporus arcularius HHB13444]|uniref:Uncharacterized protein n=1 Tax=Polyporus arcularius HHB13444 TaxID=1314778 RepID=A0A5C3PBB7_9APHY|nr:hypothetical protein K466DRAFT_587092 [Polyporus arcularius HHB13444]
MANPTNAHALPQHLGPPTRTPPAPPLCGDARLHAFAHHSFPNNAPLPLGASESDPYGDHHRLAQLGGRMLAAAYAQACMATVRGVDLQAHIDATLPAFVDRWVSAYGWRHQVYGAPGGTDLGAPYETQKIFEAYAGAVVAQPTLGPPALFAWIQLLVNTP